MTTIIHSSLAAVALASLALIPVGLVGCGNGQDRNTATVKASSSVAGEVSEAARELDQVQSGLKRVQDSSDGSDLKKSYGEVKSHASALKSSLGDVASSSDSAVSAGRKQISEWHQQADTFTDAELRNSSNKREGDLRVAVDALAGSNSTLKTARDSYEADLAQTLKALDLDLSQPGVASAKHIIGKLVDDEAGLRKALTDVSEKSSALATKVDR